MPDQESTTQTQGSRYEEWPINTGVCIIAPLALVFHQELCISVRSVNETLGKVMQHVDCTRRDRYHMLLAHFFSTVHFAL